uniref:Uncharacterized protein n=1 Tax=Hordeum vulgare subsp. vulgare TaxID=112509 RepID=A0A8I6XG90_HORVV
MVLHITLVDTLQAGWQMYICSHSTIQNRTRQLQFRSCDVNDASSISVFWQSVRCLLIRSTPSTACSHRVASLSLLHWESYQWQREMLWFPFYLFQIW